MAVAGTATVTDSVAKVAGAAIANSVAAKDSTAAEASMVVMAFVEITLFTVAAGSIEGAASTREAGPTGEATGSCYCILVSHLSGWQPMLPAVFFFPWISSASRERHFPEWRLENRPSNDWRSRDCTLKQFDG
jgi:hypothetical protein